MTVKHKSEFSTAKYTLSGYLNKIIGLTNWIPFDAFYVTLKFEILVFSVFAINSQLG